jgi:hypothetical protein
MTVSELMTYRVPEDPTSPVPAGGCGGLRGFYEGGFGVPSH